MRYFRLDLEEMRHCEVSHADYISGDQLCYLLEQGWTIETVQQELYLYSGRQVSVYVFGIMLGKQLTHVNLVSNPFISKMAHRIRLQKARKAQRKQSREQASDVAYAGTA